MNGLSRIRKHFSFFSVLLLSFSVLLPAFEPAPACSVLPLPVCVPFRSVKAGAFSVLAALSEAPLSARRLSLPELPADQ